LEPTFEFMSTEPENIPALPSSKNKVYLAESQCPLLPLTKAIVLQWFNATEHDSRKFRALWNL